VGGTGGSQGRFSGFPGEAELAFQSVHGGAQSAHNSPALCVSENAVPPFANICQNTQRPPGQLQRSLPAEPEQHTAAVEAAVRPRAAVEQGVCPRYHCQYLVTFSILHVVQTGCLQATLQENLAARVRSRQRNRLLPSPAMYLQRPLPQHHAPASSAQAAPPQASSQLIQPPSLRNKGLDLPTCRHLHGQHGGILSRSGPMNPSFRWLLLPHLSHLSVALASRDPVGDVAWDERQSVPAIVLPCAPAT
jgi:hypothetical protein